MGMVKCSMWSTQCVRPGEDVYKMIFNRRDCSTQVLYKCIGMGIQLFPFVLQLLTIVDSNISFYTRKHTHNKYTINCSPLKCNTK